MIRGFDKKVALKTILSIVMISMGLTSLIWAFEIRAELDNFEIEDYGSLDSETKQKLQLKILNFLIEFIFGIIMVPWGGSLLMNIIFNLKYRRLNYSKERKVAHFQTQFGFGLLMIAVLISFSIQSMTDNRYEWMYLWGSLAMIGVIWLVIYREKKLNEIFDSDHDIIR